MQKCVQKAIWKKYGFSNVQNQKVTHKFTQKLTQQ
jgi:hypothetical protein